MPTAETERVGAGPGAGRIGLEARSGPGQAELGASDHGALSQRPPTRSAFVPFYSLGPGRKPLMGPRYYALGRRLKVIRPGP